MLKLPLSWQTFTDLCCQKGEREKHDCRRERALAEELVNAMLKPDSTTGNMSMWARRWSSLGLSYLICKTDRLFWISNSCFAELFIMNTAAENSSRSLFLLSLQVSGWSWGPCMGLADLSGDSEWPLCGPSSSRRQPGLILMPTAGF